MRLLPGTFHTAKSDFREQQWEVIGFYDLLYFLHGLRKTSGQFLIVHLILATQGIIAVQPDVIQIFPEEKLLKS